MWPKNPKTKLLMSAAVVFALCVSTGFWIAGKKPVWNDEIYSLVASVQAPSYGRMLAGGIGEGNNAPLFYVLQKAFLQVIGYQVPPEWQRGEHSIVAADSRVILRVNPVVCMSLSMALVFYYFSRRYSILAGGYSLFIYFSSYMLWVYWAEARPYALVVFLTTAQSLVLLNFLDQGRNKNSRTWMALAGVHVLLALTSIFSIGQIVAASVLCWSRRMRGWKKYIFLTFVPCATALFYYAHAPKYQFYFDLTPEQLLRDNISRDRFYILFMFGVWLLAQKLVDGSALLKARPYFLFTVLTIAAASAVLGIFILNQPSQPEGFPITSRYFIYLTPIGVMATTFFSLAILQSLSGHRWLQGGVSVLIGYWLLQRFFKIVPSALHSVHALGSGG